MCVLVFWLCCVRLYLAKCVLFGRVLRLQKGHKYCLLGKLSSEVGWNHYDTIRVSFDFLVSVFDLHCIVDRAEGLITLEVKCCV